MAQKKSGRPPAQQVAWKKRLAAMQGAYEEAGRIQNEFDDKPDGTYVAKLTAGEIRESQNEGNLGVLLTFSIQEGEFEGQKITSWDGLNDDKPNAIAFLRKKLRIMGCEVPDDISELPEAIAAMVAAGPVVRIKLQDHDGYQRKTILKTISWDGGDEGEEEVEEPKPRGKAGAKTSKAKPDPEEDAEEVEEDAEEEEDEEAARRLQSRKPASKSSGKAGSKPARGKAKPEPEPEPEEEVEEEPEEEEVEYDTDDAEEPEEELVALEVGNKVRVMKPDGETVMGTGKVKSINEADSTASVTMDKGGKTFRISFDRLAVID